MKLRHSGGTLTVMIRPGKRPRFMAFTSTVSPKLKPKEKVINRIDGRNEFLFQIWIPRTVARVDYRKRHGKWPRSDHRALMKTIRKAQKEAGRR